MNITTDPVTAARAAALFVSDLTAGRRPTPAQAEYAIGCAIRDHGGTRGCVADMAAYYGDYPELAAVRMGWARSVAESLRQQPPVSRPALRPELVLAA